MAMIISGGYFVIIQRIRLALKNPKPNPKPRGLS